jgi:hypothetical protein
MWYKTWKPWSYDYVIGTLNHWLFEQDNRTLKTLIIWWYKIWNPSFIGKNCFGSFALVSHGYVLHLGFAKMWSSSRLHKECQYICEEMLGFFVCDTHKITIAYRVILVFWFCRNWHTMVYLQSVFLIAESLKIRLCLKNMHSIQKVPYSIHYPSMQASLCLWLGC